MNLSLDRMALDDVGANPTRLAAAIHRQLGEGEGAVPVVEIAKALDIVEIRVDELRNVEGALITPPERGYGSILVNRRSNKGRRRFTIGHELMHFLSPLHLPTSPAGFRCSRQDMIANQVDAKDRHLRQEAEANLFAIELLAPLPRIKRFLRSEPDLAFVLSMADDLDISKEAAAKRYVACHQETLAVVFSRNDRFLYADRSKSFPWITLNLNQMMPSLPMPADNDGLSSVEDADPSEWLDGAADPRMTVQTLRQQAGHATTLLRIDTAAEEDDDGGIDDTYQRFTRFAP